MTENAGSSSCPPADVLEHIALGRLTEGNYSSHFKVCSACRDQLDEIRRNDAFLKDMVEKANLEPMAIPGGSPQETSGKRIGPYKLLELIGEGGFGQVFLAEQEHPVRRRVALKIIKLGMDTKQVIARFEAERQALAMMDHPHIARVLDAGATDTGRPFFVMELVRGVPVTQHCDSAGLTTEERLALFIPICHAIQHAHQKGIIHRDLKPSNVLVTLQDGVAVPKVIDFGIAKAMNAPLTERTIYTEHRQMIGTLEYMSPEQADTAHWGVDTRSDIYSLGVMLYEILVGCTPFDRQTLRLKGYTEVQRIIREDDPPTPSTRLGMAGDGVTEIAKQRKTHPEVLRRQLSGEIDWIVMKCLEKSQVRRYETATALADDLHRHRMGQPVLAGPHTTAYFVKKFIGRHRGPVIAAGLVTAALALGLLGTGLSLRQAILARDQAQRERRRSEATATFQARMLARLDASNPGRLLSEDILARFRQTTQGMDMTEAAKEQDVESFARFWRRVNTADAAHDLIDQAIVRPSANYIDQDYKDEPGMAATVRDALADRYEAVGMNAAALPLRERALEVYRRENGEDHPDTASATAKMGVLLAKLGKLDRAEVLLREAVEKYNRITPKGDPNRTAALGGLGVILLKRGKHIEAEPFLRESLEQGASRSGEASADRLLALNNLAGQIEAKGDFAEAERLYLEVLRLAHPALGPEHEITVTATGNLGQLLLKEGNYAEAEGLLRANLDIRRRNNGDQDPLTWTALNLWASVLQGQNRLDEAEPILREVVALRRRSLGAEHPDTLGSTVNLASLMYEQKKLDEAQPLALETMEALRRVLGEQSDAWLASASLVARIYKDQNQLDRSEPLTRKVLEICERLRGPTHPMTLLSIKNMGDLLRRQGQMKEAETLLVPAATTHLKSSPNDRAARELVKAIVSLYETWNLQEPGQGYADKAVEWKGKLPATPSAKQ